MRRAFALLIMTSGLALSPQPAPFAAEPDPPAAVESPAMRINRVSFYSAERSQTDADPQTASCGRNLAPYVQVAVSRDLFYGPDGRKRCGARVRLVLDDGTQIEGVVWDTTAAWVHRRYGPTVDVLVPSRQEALRRGLARGNLYWID